jgi:LmbE family N-acetylglucosaminyl deacetylase
MSNILILAAHPDDEILGCGGIIKKFSDKGHRVDLLTFTDGEGARNNGDINRNLLLEKVKAIIGINGYKYANFPDNAMDTIPFLSIVQFIEQSVEYFPDYIFTHSMHDLNIDHQIVCKATLTAFRPQRGHKHQIYSYYIPSSTDYNPLSQFHGTAYFELNEAQVKSKMDALKIYDKEIFPKPHSRSYTNIKNLMEVWGNEVGLNFAEKFEHIRTVY